MHHSSINFDMTKGRRSSLLSHSRDNKINIKQTSTDDQIRLKRKKVLPISIESGFDISSSSKVSNQFATSALDISKDEKKKSGPITEMEKDHLATLNN